jgi:hypothetical protein
MMSNNTPQTPPLMGHGHGKQTLIAETNARDSNHEEDEVYDGLEDRDLVRKLVRKIDLRLCTIAGILCSLNLLGEFMCIPSERREQ